MIVTYDTEFLDDGRTIDLFSIGLVNERGDTLYRINADADYGRALDSPWIRKNVILKHLPIKAWRTGWTWDDDHPDRELVLSKQALAETVEDWLRWCGGPNDAELWAYYPATDHVALYQLFGPMIECTEHGMPMRTSCLKQQEVMSERAWQQQNNYHVGEGALALREAWRRSRPIQHPDTEHHALHDALHDMDLARWMGVPELAKAGR